MLKSDLREMVYTIPMPVFINSAVVISTKKVAGTIKEIVTLTGITEKDCKNLSQGIDINIKRDNILYTITADDVYCFGKIDFNEGSDDCKELNTFKWLDDLFVKGVCIPANYNYDNHECKSPIKTYLYTETFNISTLCRYLHGSIGKPEFSLIFKRNV